MSYTELEHGYQGLRQATQPQFYVGDDGDLVQLRSPVSQQHYIRRNLTQHIENSINL